MEEENDPEANHQFLGFDSFNLLGCIFWIFFSFFGEGGRVVWIYSALGIFFFVLVVI